MYHPSWCTADTLLHTALRDSLLQNARLLAAYVEKKQEAAHLQDALRRQQRQSEVRACGQWHQCMFRLASLGPTGRVDCM